MKRMATISIPSRAMRCIAALMLLTSGLPASAQEYAGFVDDVRNATTDSLMNIGGMEYYLLYEDYEKVHFLSMLSENREVSVIGPAMPADTLYQNGFICGHLGVEQVRRPLSEMRNDSMLVTCKYPSLFERCETVSPCNFKVCDSNNFGYKLIFDFRRRHHRFAIPESVPQLATDITDQPGCRQQSKADYRRPQEQDPFFPRNFHLSPSGRFQH